MAELLRRSGAISQPLAVGAEARGASIRPVELSDRPLKERMVTLTIIMINKDDYQNF
jgi:hypothetical protein